MRIQHNIMAMNAYRNYNNNNKALSGNLEKLSSGYKINRAGDDAAGLAISEKMRAQITGLNAAQKNVKDGISLVKTAEGAMQEIQDMLNRMDYLATQSANGTYQDEVDREALQKEVNQLNEEINRIADSANFNGIKLLDGTWDADGKTKAVQDAQAALDAANKALEDAKAGIKADPIYGDPMSTDEIKDLMLPEVGPGLSGSAANVGTNTVLETEKVEYQKPSFQVNLNGVKHTMTTAAIGGNGVATGGNGAITVTVDGTALSITEDDIAKYLQDRKLVDDADIKAGLEVDSETLAAVFANKYKAADSFTDSSGAGDKWNVRADGESLVFEYSSTNTAPTQTLNKHFDTSITRLSGTTVDATGGKFTTGTYTASTTATGADTSISVTAKIGGKNVTFTGTADAAVTAGSLATAVGNAEATIDGKTVKLSDYFNVGTTGVNGNDGKLTLTSIATGKDGSDSIEKFSLTPGAPGATGGAAPTYASVAKKDAWTDGTDAYTPGTNGYINAGTEVTITGVPAASDQLASTTLDFSDLDIVDGMKIKLGDTEYTFAVGADSKYADAENVVDLTATDAKKLMTIANGGTQADRDLALSKLAEAAKDNAIFTVSHEKNGTAPAAIDQIGLKQKAEVKDTTDMTTMDKFAGYIGISTVDQAATDAAQKELDAAQPELIAKAEEDVKAAQEALDNASAGAAKALNLQIGDTSDEYNQLGVKIGSMKTSALGVEGLSIATAEDAAAAIDVIKDAINYVSSVRGDLGAYQNRLDHTANNLSVMAENIQDAESTIRDTDVAEEMMSYVKNNILVQSAQAMLAQANQVPQGVLQLLG